MVYNYTKPRGPIAAMFNSPGPCYALPGLVGYKRHDPRSVHTRGPAYPISGRHEDGPGGGGRRASSPGPAAYNPDSRTLRTGRDGTPRYTLSGRNERSGRSVTPGPGAYAPENAGPSARRCVTPSFSFGVRGRDRSYDDIPGPNQYSVPSMLCRTVQSGKGRQAPAYSLSSRSRVGSFHEDYQKTPGPGAYKVTDLGIFKSRPPSCRIASRNLPPSDDTRKPGPGAHSPERVWVHKQYSPQFTFGIRHSPYSSPLIVRTGEF